ncbi:MAG TPA: hypothetical protein VMU38_04740 [Candidatus Binatia bacterium]|nr:hypothetical protein [Candidatus Binatia bacterium]
MFALQRNRPMLRAIPIAISICLVASTRSFADDAATLESWQSSFHDVWQSDQCATEFESWNKYWGAVHAFYFGGSGYAGWFPDSQKILAHVTDAAANATIAAQLAALGRRVGGEWAKGDGCRSVRTRTSWMEKVAEPGKPALLDWETQLNKAAAADTGNGASIEAAIASINKQLDALGVAAVPA